jgi:metal-responsive CopG/Arc/MetJ family transcriptional regulator
MTVNISVTLPEKVVHKIDIDRGEINRSKYILKLLEAGYSNLKKQNKLLLHVEKQGVGRSCDQHAVGGNRTALESDTDHE